MNEHKALHAEGGQPSFQLGGEGPSPSRATKYRQTTKWQRVAWVNVACIIVMATFTVIMLVKGSYWIAAWDFVAVVANIPAVYLRWTRT